MSVANVKISNSNTNSQLEIGNTGTGNTSTLATFNNSKTQTLKPCLNSVNSVNSV